MSVRVDSSSWIPGAIVVGNRGFGILGASIPATGDNGASFLHNDLSLPADNGKEICGRITSWPTNGTLVANENGAFTYTPLSDGQDSFAYQLKVDGANVGSPTTVSLQVGSPLASFAITTADTAAAFAARVLPVAAFNLSTDPATFAGGAGTLAAAAFNITTEGATPALSAVSKPIAAFNLSTGSATFAGGAGTTTSAGFNLQTADATFSGGATVRPLAAFSGVTADAVFVGGASIAGAPATASFAATTADATASFSAEVVGPAASECVFSVSLADVVFAGSASGGGAFTGSLSDADVARIAAAVLQAIASLQVGTPLQVQVVNSGAVASDVWGFTLP